MSASDNPMLEVLLNSWRCSSDAVFSDEYIVRFQTEGYCQVITNGCLEGVADKIIEREIAHHRSIGRSFEWAYFSLDLPTDLKQKLVEHGFQPGIKEVICMIETDAIASQDIGSYRVERARDEKGLADFRAVAEAVFAKDFSYTTGVLAECLREGKTSETGFVAYDGDIPVSIGRLSWPDGSQIAGLYTGGTLETHRGKGFYRAVVCARAKVAQEIGAKYLSVDARPTSLPILTRLGFEPVVESWPCDWTFPEP